MIIHTGSEFPNLTSPHPDKARRRRRGDAPATHSQILVYAATNIRTAGVRAREDLGHRGGAMQDPACGLPRIPLLGTSVNKILPGFIVDSSALLSWGYGGGEGQDNPKDIPAQDQCFPGGKFCSPYGLVRVCSVSPCPYRFLCACLFFFGTFFFYLLCSLYRSLYRNLWYSRDILTNQ
jgi:hypothetical protein